MRSTARTWTIRFLPRVDIATNLSLRLFGTRVRLPAPHIWPRVAHVYFGESGVAGHGRSDRRRVSSPHGFGSLVSVASSITAAVDALDVMLHI